MNKVMIKREKYNFVAPLSIVLLVLSSYRNQSIDLLCKSIDWFLYEGNTGI